MGFLTCPVRIEHTPHRGGNACANHTRRKFEANSQSCQITILNGLLPGQKSKPIVLSNANGQGLTMYHDITASESDSIETREDTALRFDMNELYKWLERPIMDDEDDIS